MEGSDSWMIIHKINMKQKAKLRKKESAKVMVPP